MTPYQIQGPARQCAATGRELRPGERIYSVLLEEAGQFVRKDYAADAWPGPPANSAAYWCGRIPASGAARRPTINEEWLIDCFTHLSEATEPAQRNFRYVVALLLMRRKRLKFDDVKLVDGEEYLLLRDARTGARYEVLDPRLNEAEANAVQEEVFRVLGWA
ncbi:MAG: hypothetical protein K8T89_06605 [Planctomycetes bacterium]|nr:hypothetical protein [Planctomycetota bacterium]